MDNYSNYDCYDDFYQGEEPTYEEVEKMLDDEANYRCEELALEEMIPEEEFKVRTVEYNFKRVEEL